MSPDIDVVPLPNNEMLFRSDRVAVRLGGESSLFFVEQILPLLDGQRSFDQLTAELTDTPSEVLQGYLDQLVQIQILQRLDKPQHMAPMAEQVLEPFLTMLNTLGLPPTASIEKLRAFHIAIVGLEGPGAHIASILGQCGIGRLTLVDPFPCHPGNLALMPVANTDSIGKPRQKVVKAMLAAHPTTTEIVTAETQALTPETMAALVADHHFVIGCFDRGFLAANQWLNQASLKWRIPAIYVEAAGHMGWVGPLVAPGQTACYDCFRRRRLATADSIDEAIAYETYLSQRHEPVLHHRGVLPAMMPYLASMAVMDIFKHLLSLSQSTLMGQVLAFNALTSQTNVHPVLQKPDCSICHGRSIWPRSQPILTELASMPSSAGDLLAVASQLVDSQTGVVKSTSPIFNNDGDQAHFFHAELANHQPVADDDRRVLHALGKGLNSNAARAGALGEAIESYAGLCWSYDEIVYARRSDLDKAALDPRQLGLYLPFQYEHLPYVPYQDESRLGWVAARSLVTGDEVYIPALAVFMTYKPPQPQEFICPTTSNGLATGTTLAEAILRATLEVIERDAFIITWLNRLPCRQIDVSNHPDRQLVELCETYRRKQVALRLIQIPTDQPCFVFLALAVQLDGSGPAVVTGLGADIEPDRAARQAILEAVQTRTGMQATLHKPETQQQIKSLVSNPSLVKVTSDHALRYANPATRPAFDFLLNQPVISLDWSAHELMRSDESTVARLTALVASLRSQGQDLIYCNMTPPDMGRLGLHTARVVLPGFQPIYFGRQARRLACPRLYELPQHLDFSEAPTEVDQLNDDPHPFA
ncbi:MAG: TOMM precursor leader peptide-binding protein [Anaerolineae bacterium]|nr:TOMM precursor leader peptide-binding protein [Anaerolineae bacterium]